MPHDHMGNVVIKFPPEFNIVSSMSSFWKLVTLFSLESSNDFFLNKYLNIFFCVWKYYLAFSALLSCTPVLLGVVALSCALLYVDLWDACCWLSTGKSAHRKGCSPGWQCLPVKSLMPRQAHQACAMLVSVQGPRLSSCAVHVFL